MNYFFLYRITFFIYLSVPTFFLPNAISYSLSQGRFGDHILAFSKALYIGHEYNLPIIYVPFEYSAQLQMHTDPYLAHPQKTPRSRTIHIQPETDIRAFSSTYLIYMANLGTKHRGLTHLDSIYDCMVADPTFESLLKKMLTPTVPVYTMTLPHNIITVALHVRKGGGFDQPLLSKQITCPQEDQTILKENSTKYQNRVYLQYADQRWPHKFPPDQYYIDQLIFLSELLDDAPLYVYLFTDDPNPKNLVQKYQEYINKPTIIFDYRSEKNRHNMNVLDDYWNMAQFDCLIRAASNFSRSVQLLGNHKIILFPKHAGWQGDRVIVDKIGIVIRNQHKNIFFRKSISTAEPNPFLLKQAKRACNKCFIIE